MRTSGALSLVVTFAAVISEASQAQPAPQLRTIETPAGPQRLIVAPDTPEAKQRAALDQFKLEKYTWKKGGFDNVMLATFKFANGNNFDVKDIEIQCRHSGESGTRIDGTSRTIFQVVKAKSSRTVADFNMGLIHSQAASTSCSVVGLKLAGTARPNRN